VLYPQFWKQSKAKRKAILEHEYAHYVYFEIMTDLDRRAWESISNFTLSERVKKGLQGYFKNEYINSHARKFPSEDFAEMHEDYILYGRRKFGNYLDIKSKVALAFMERYDPR